MAETVAFVTDDGETLAGEVAIAAEPVLAELLGYPFHRGCIALVPRPRLLGDDLARRLDALAGGPRVRLVAAHRIADAANVGALVRTCRALGVDAVAFDRGCADPWSRRAVRAAMGHTFGQSVLADVDTLEFVAAARRRILDLVVAVASVRAGAVPLDRVRPAARTLVLFGNEGHGLPPALVDAADVELTIPMRNGVDSLNVASAAAVILWALGDPRPAVQ